MNFFTAFCSKWCRIVSITFIKLHCVASNETIELPVLPFYRLHTHTLARWAAAVGTHTKTACQVSCLRRFWHHREHSNKAIHIRLNSSEWSLDVQKFDMIHFHGSDSIRFYMFEVVHLHRHFNIEQSFGSLETIIYFQSMNGRKKNYTGYVILSENPSAGHCEQERERINPDSFPIEWKMQRKQQQQKLLKTHSRSFYRVGRSCS